MLDDMSLSEVSSFVFPENRFEAIEEIRRLLGLTEGDFACMIRLLCKSCYGNLNFVFGAVSIALSSQEEEVFDNATYGDITKVRNEHLLRSVTKAAALASRVMRLSAASTSPSGPFMTIPIDMKSLQVQRHIVRGQ
jgi:hypothetical protein